MSTTKTTVKPRVSFYTRFVKRFFDIFLCTLALVALSPLLLFVSVLELICHGRPIFYVTKRPGLNGKIIKLFKFRSMTNKKGEDGLLLPEEQRLTRFGYYLRKLSIDELPELISIIKGDMSIIGPRPLLVEYLDLYSPRHMMRHAVRPGLACPKVFKKGEPHVHTGTWREQFESDIYYVEHVSFLYDLKVFLAVIQEIFAHDEYRAADTRVPFDGTNLDETRSKNEVENAVRYNSVAR
ncbi:sugar transferase [Clostridium sp. chh4-2]|uniref:sugar transferase n=1 Tax=Clostridium sp. chh4-2 TaxID=2067550 RepID=UPI000CCEC3EF|nr:sugar transferase [Clostridium sp. chh4-2]PNV59275.1 sugar transferase [Clostridium sp. chh4-2]